MTDDTTRRERAEKYIEDDTTVWANEWTWEGEDIINAYLAGAREEAALAAEEAKRVELCTTRLVSEYGRRLDEKDAEIAALREALTARDTFINFVRAEEAVAVSACLWTEWEEGQWEADCGLIWELSDDYSRALPSGHGMKFCPGCGRTLTEKLYVEPTVQDDDEVEP